MPNELVERVINSDCLIPSDDQGDSRNDLALTARNAMRDANMAVRLNMTRPTLTFDEMLAARSKEYSGNCLYKKIVIDAETELGAMRTVKDPGGCFIAGTLVHTKEGLKPIEEIKVGDYVLSKPEDGKGEQAYKRVTKTLQFEEKEVWYVEIYPKSEIEQARREGRVYDEKKLFRLIVTPNHPFWVKGIGWTSADQLNELNTFPIELELASGEIAEFSMAGPMKRTAKPDIGWGQITDAGAQLTDYGILVDLIQGGKSAEFGRLSGNIDTCNDYSIDYKIDVAWNKPENSYHCTVYNLEVEDFHTYYVGTNGVWVHNTNCVTFYTQTEVNKLDGDINKGVILVERVTRTSPRRYRLLRQ